MPKRQPQATLRTPHPFHVFLNNSHPPLDARLKAIRDYHGKCYNESMWVAQPAKEKWLPVAVTPRFVNRAPCSCLREVGWRLGWFILRCVVLWARMTLASWHLCLPNSCDTCVHAFSLKCNAFSLAFCSAGRPRSIRVAPECRGPPVYMRLQLVWGTPGSSKSWSWQGSNFMSFHRFLQYLSAKSCLDFAQFSARRPWQPHDL